MSAKSLPLPANVASLQPYESARSLLKGDGWVFLDANESPYAGVSSLPQIAQLNRYPDPTADVLRDAIAEYYRVKRENIIVSNGSDELIDLSVRSFVRKGRSVLSFRPTYGMYRVICDINRVSYNTVNLNEDFTLDETALFTQGNSDLLFLCNPNNPTGTIIGMSAIERMVSNFSGLTVVDEAYGEFADAEFIPSSIELVKRGINNLLVLRTFSKAFGSAGIRVGYGIADAAIIDILLKMKPPYNVNAMSQACGLKLWKERAQMEKNVQVLLRERKRLMDGCRKLGCKIFPTVTNFFLVQLPATVDSNEIYTRLCDQYRIILRQIKGLPQKNILRISVGSPEENELFLLSLSSLL